MMAQSIIVEELKLEHTSCSVSRKDYHQNEVGKFPPKWMQRIEILRYLPELSCDSDKLCYKTDKVACLQFSMEEPRNRYILLRDRVGIIRKTKMFGFSTKSTPTQVLKGELLEALPEEPNMVNRIALAAIDRKTLRLECGADDVARLTSEDANLLLAISSIGPRYEIYIDRNRLDFGRRISPGSQVLVEVKGISRRLHGMVWFKGDLPQCPGTMFGVELYKNPGLGTSDGTFRNKQYFSCPPDSGVFVGLDKLTPLEDSDMKSPPKSPKRDETAQGNFASRLVPSFLKEKKDQRLPWKRTDHKLEIDQRVVTFAGDVAIRGTVRYIGEEKQDGQVHTIVGLELDKRCGSGTGKLKGKQLFVAKRDYATFVDIETIIPEKDFDENTGKAATSRNEDPVSKQIQKDELLARSMSYDHNRLSGDESVKKLRRTGSVNSADHDVIMAAGESSKTNHTSFIEQQERMLHEFKSSKVSASKDNDVEMRSEEKTDSASNLNLPDDHYRSTSPDSVLRKNTPITKQPGLSDGTTKWYTEYDHIENDEYEKLVQQHENSRHVHSLIHQDHAKPLAAEVVSDNHSPVASYKPEGGGLSKEPAEQLEHEKALLHAEGLASDKVPDLSVQSSGDIPNGLEVGSMVQVPMAQGVPRYGVIKWIGYVPGVKDKLVAGLELEDELSALSDGTFNGERYFTCPAGKGFFTLLAHCRQDSRSAPNSPISDEQTSKQVPPEILARGALASAAYNNALREGRTLVKSVPIMLIGQDRSGKTSLKKSLRGERFNPDEDSTVGINKDPSHFKVTTEIWKTGNKGEATNSDTVISYEHLAAQLIVSNLTEEKRAPTEGALKSAGASLSAVHESAEIYTFASEERDLETDAEQDQFGGIPIRNTNEPKVPDEIAALVDKLLLDTNKGEDEQDVYSVLWDFGGQSVYYVTHPLFLTPRAMYLLVYDLSRNPHDKANPIQKQGMFRKIEDHFSLRVNLDYLDFWMTSVASLSSQNELHQEHPGSKPKMLPDRLPPVFLVCTHADKPHGGADPFALAHEIFDSLQRKPYNGQLVDRVFVVNNTKSGSHSECAEVIRLRQDVLAVAKELPQMKEAIPIKWLKYQKALRATTVEEGFKWISLETAKQIASEVCEINDDEEFLTLLNFLHDQRYLIHFDDSVVLNNLVVLDLQWLVDVFKMVITVRPYDFEERKFKELWRKLETTGILEETLLEHVWGPLLKQRETAESLLAVMEKFSLLCPWPSSHASCTKQYFVPSMLMSHPPQEIKNLVASAQIPSLFLKFESVRFPPSFFPRLVLQFYQWCTEEFPTQLTPQLFHNFARFYISSVTGCSVVLLCHLSAVEVVFLGKCRDVSVTENFQLEVNLSAEVSNETFDVTSAVVVRSQLALMVDSMRKEFCWLKNMRCTVSFLCPVCSNGGSVNYCLNHRTEGCKQEECLHFLSELQLLKSEENITCNRSAAAQDVKVPINQFTPWFAFDCGKNQLGSEDSTGLLPFEQTMVIQHRQDNSLVLPCDVVQTLQSPCTSHEVVDQLQGHLRLNQSSLNQPDPENKKWIRCLATEAKRLNRLDVVKHLRDITPAGTTGPLLPEQLDIQDIPVAQMMELTIDLSGGDEWRLVAERLGLSPKVIRYLEKRTMNPCNEALAFISERCSISVGQLYDLLNECGLPVVADNL